MHHGMHGRDAEIWWYQSLRCRYKTASNHYCSHKVIYDWIGEKIGGGASESAAVDELDGILSGLQQEYKGKGARPHTANWNGLLKQLRDARKAAAGDT